MQKATRRVLIDGMGTSLKYYEDLGRGIYEYDFPIHYTLRGLRRKLADRHNLSCDAHTFKAAIRALLQEHPAWVQYKQSLFYRPSAEYIAGLSDEDLANSHYDKWTCGGGSYVTSDARQLAQDVLGMTEPGHTLEDIKILRKAGMVHYQRHQAEQRKTHT